MSSTKSIDLAAVSACMPEEVLVGLSTEHARYVDRVDREVFAFVVNAANKLVADGVDAPQISRDVSTYYEKPLVPLRDAILDASLYIAGGNERHAFDEDETVEQKVSTLQSMLLWDFFDGRHTYGSCLSPSATVASNLLLSHALGKDVIDYLRDGNLNPYGNESYMPGWYKLYFGAVDELAGITLLNGAPLTYGITKQNIADLLLESKQFKTVATYPRSLGMQLHEGHPLLDQSDTKDCLLQGQCLSLGFNFRGEEPHDRRVFSPIRISPTELVDIAAANKGKLGGIRFPDLQRILQLDEMFADLDATERRDVFTQLLEADPGLGFTLYAKYRQGIMHVYEVFGANATVDAHDLTEGIMSGGLGEVHEILGITKKGKPGLDQLKSIIDNLVAELVAPGKSDEELASLAEKMRMSRIYQALARSALNYDDTQWKRMSWGSSEFIGILEGLANGRCGAERPVVPESITTSPVFQIATYDKTTAERVRLDSELLQVLSCFQAVVQDFSSFKHKAYHYNDLRGMISEAIDDPDNIGTLKRVMETAIMIAYDASHAGSVDYELQRELEAMLGVNHQQNAETILEVVGHRIIDEGLVLDKSEKALLKEIFRLKKFEAYLDRVGDGQVYVPKGTVRELRLVPSKDVGFEFAGDIGDACYTRVENAGRLFPNMTAILICDVTGGQQKLAGSMIFIEATDQTTGRKTLIMRAVNPRETWLKKHKDGELLNLIVEYSKGVAKKMDAQLAMVIDRSGGAATNRRTLFKAMEKYKQGDPLVLDSREVAFNGHELHNSVFAVF